MSDKPDFEALRWLYTLPKHPTLSEQEAAAVIAALVAVIAALVDELAASRRAIDVTSAKNAVKKSPYWGGPRS